MFDEITILTLLTIKTKSSLPWHVCQDRPLSHYLNIGNRKFLPIVLTTIFKLMKTRLNLNSRFTWHGVRRRQLSSRLLLRVLMYVNNEDISIVQIDAATL